MRYTWEEEDIYAGRRVLSWNKTDEYVIGYDPRIETRDNWALVALSDGLILKNGCSTKTMVKLLNDELDHSVYVVNPPEPNTYPYLPKDIR